VLPPIRRQSACPKSAEVISDPTMQAGSSRFNGSK
jgi:hypothetical protein